MAQTYGEYLSKQPIVPASPGPDYGPVSKEDSETMDRALKGAENRATGMAHQTAEKATNDYAHVRAARK